MSRDIALRAVLMRREVLVLEDVVKVYKASGASTQALRGVSLRVHSGDFIAIMGPSGSGKTTLLNIMGLLDKPTSGRVLVDGVDVSRLSSSEIARIRNYKIGFVFQFYNLINRLTVLENIEIPLIPRGLPRSKRVELATKAILRAGGELTWLPKKPNQLSGGQQQRVAIARAIVGEPEIILADEPTGNLDVASSRVVVKTFQELNKAGATILVVTHNPEVANCTQKIHVIRDGVFVNTLGPDPSKCILNTT
ncbi:MAG: ABC transporter ATP-binding protein [Desulfurococcaceae archaeon]|jgi:putative ABC transport system ATP-binding protein|nr:ABC transporter ATP-binding protein [Desulfurococcaceae archaeon]